MRFNYPSEREENKRFLQSSLNNEVKLPLAETLKANVKTNYVKVQL